MMKKPAKPDPAQPDLFSFTPIMVPQGDGSFVVKPGKPVLKHTVQQAARIAGGSVWTIYRLFASGILTGERPSPRKILIHAESLNAHLEKSKDPEYWEDPERAKRYRATFNLQKKQAVQSC